MAFWNVLADWAKDPHGGNISPEKLEWAQRFLAIQDKIRAMDVSHIGLVEVDVAHSQEWLEFMKACGFDAIHVPKGQEQPLDGTCVGSRQTLIGHEVVRAEGVSQVAVLTHTVRCGVPVTIVTLHLKAKEGPVEEEARCKLIAAVLERVKHLPHVIIGGDWNAVLGARPLRMVEEAGFVVVTSAAPSTMKKAAGHEYVARRIDHVAMRSTAFDAEELSPPVDVSPFGSKNWLPNDGWPSDHLAVPVRLTLKDED